MLAKRPEERVVQTALNWVGRHYREGESAQCANFVRYVFAAAQVDLGEAKNPTDKKYMPGMQLGSSFANSFAGDDVGELIQRRDVRAGDVLLFRNTYGSYPTGVITHVGIAVNGVEMVDRSTSSAPVKRRGIDTFVLAEARRPWAYSANVEANPEQRIIKAFFHGGNAETLVDGKQLGDPTVSLDFTERARMLRVNGRERELLAYEVKLVFREPM